jgi:hypothetical protein
MLREEIHTHTHTKKKISMFLQLHCIFQSLSWIQNTDPFVSTACSLGLSATGQLYFSLRTNQPPANSTFLSAQISTSHRPPAKRTG